HLLLDSRNRHSLVWTLSGVDVGVEMSRAAGVDRPRFVRVTELELRAVLYARREWFRRESVAVVLRLRRLRVDRTDCGRSERQYAPSSANYFERDHVHGVVLRFHFDRFVWRFAGRTLASEQCTDGGSG